MKKLKMGCLLLFICIGVVVVIVAVMSAGSESKSTAPENKVVFSRKLDRIESKYGMSEQKFKGIAYDYSKDVVRKYFRLPDYYSFPFTTVQQVFFEFEKRDDKGNLIGEWIGVNVNNKFVIKNSEGIKIEHIFYSTFHYDPAARKWHCSSFLIDDKKLDVKLD